MTNDYADRRRAYVAEIRNSFETDTNEKVSERVNVSAEPSFFMAKLQLFTAVLIFGLFLYLKLTETELCGYSTKDIVDMITDNHYYTKLAEYDILLPNKI